MTLKDKLLFEALRQFSSRGYSVTSTTSIIEAVGTSKGGLYNHFKNKEQLFLEALSLARKIWREKNLQGLSEIQRPIDRIIRLLENYRDSYLTDTTKLPGGCIFVNLAVELSDEYPKLSEEVNEGFLRLRKLIERLLYEEQQLGSLAKRAQPTETAELIFTGILGACVVYKANKSTTTLHQTIGALCNFLNQLKR